MKNVKNKHDNHYSQVLSFIEGELKNKGMFPYLSQRNKTTKEKIPKINKNIQELLDDLCKRKKMNFFSFDLFKNGNTLSLWNKDCKDILYQENDIFTYIKEIKKPIKQNIEKVIKKNSDFKNKVDIIKEKNKKANKIYFGKYEPNYAYLKKHVPIIDLDLIRRCENHSINKNKKIDVQVCHKYKKLYENIRNSNSISIYQSYLRKNKRIKYNKSKNSFYLKDSSDIKNDFNQKNKCSSSRRSNSVYVNNYKYNSILINTHVAKNNIFTNDSSIRLNKKI